MENTRLNQLEMKTVNLACPVQPEALEQLQLGDIVYLNGVIYTGREGLYKRLLDEGKSPPRPLSEISNVNFHCSPAATPLDNGQYLVKAVTATASFRFGKWLQDFFSTTGCKVIIGKGGMAESEYRRLFVPAGALYLTTVGYGLGAVYGRGVSGVKQVYWLDELGVAQALWILEVQNLGPFIVESDLKGNSLFALCNREVNARIEKCYADLPGPVLRRYGEETDRSKELI